MTTSMAARIQSARSRSSLTQTQLASYLGINRSAVAQWERLEGGTNPKIEHLCKIAELTGVRFEWLATGLGRSRARRRPQSSSVPSEQASNEFEAQCLLLLRRVPQHKRALATELLGELAGRR